eukprot:1185657-Prorocentrum_minimum.AAC.5
MPVGWKPTRCAQWNFWGGISDIMANWPLVAPGPQRYFIRHCRGLRPPGTQPGDSPPPVRVYRGVEGRGRGNAKVLSMGAHSDSVSFVISHQRQGAVHLCAGEGSTGDDALPTAVGMASSTTGVSSTVGAPSIGAMSSRPELGAGSEGTVGMASSTVGASLPTVGAMTSRAE